MNPKYLNNYRQRKALREMCGDPFFDLGFALLIRQSEFPQALSEVSVVEYDDLSQVAAWLREHDAVRGFRLYRPQPSGSFRPITAAYTFGLSGCGRCDGVSVRPVTCRDGERFPFFRKCGFCGTD